MLKLCSFLITSGVKREQAWPLSLELLPDLDLYILQFFNHAKLYFCSQVNVGCVPKKVMFNTAMMMEFLHDMKGYGYDVEVKNFNWR